MQQESRARRETCRITNSQWTTYALYCVADLGLRFSVPDVRTFQGPDAEPVLNVGWREFFFLPQKADWINLRLVTGNNGFGAKPWKCMT